MLLDVPFLPDPRYTLFLQSQADRLHSVHFSLLQPDIPDGRHQTAARDLSELNRALSALSGVKKYALLNSRFHSPATYLDSRPRARLLAVLSALLREGNIDGIVVVDFYLLQALSDASPEITGQLEAVPGVNCLLDSFDRIQSWLDLIARTRFRMPLKLNLDRSLNRRLQILEEVSSQCRRRYPGLRLTLLANEGCLYRCPFKLAHDAQIGFAHIDAGPNRTHEMNRGLGCMRVLAERPEEILRSPFIRPEDQQHYESMADVLKICGRTLGPAFLERAVAAYLTGGYAGNLLALLDTQDWQADRLSIANAEIPGDFLVRLTTCRVDCTQCGYCREVFHRISRFLPLTLKDFRGRPIVRRARSHEDSTI